MINSLIRRFDNWWLSQIDMKFLEDYLRCYILVNGKPWGEFMLPTRIEEFNNWTYRKGFVELSKLKTPE